MRKQLTAYAWDFMSPEQAREEVLKTTQWLSISKKHFTFKVFNPVWPDLKEKLLGQAEAQIWDRRLSTKLES